MDAQDENGVGPLGQKRRRLTSIGMRFVLNAAMLTLILWAIVLFEKAKPIRDSALFKSWSELNEEEAFLLAVTLTSLVLLIPVFADSLMKAFILMGHQTLSEEEVEAWHNPSSSDVYPIMSLLANDNPLVRLSAGILLMPGSLVYRFFTMWGRSMCFGCLGIVEAAAVSLAVLFDLAVNTSLFALSLYLILSSRDTAAAVVNLAAVQVFSRLDGDFIKLSLMPMLGVQHTLDTYYTSNPVSSQSTSSVGSRFRKAAGKVYCNACSQEGSKEESSTKVGASTSAGPAV